MCTIFFSLHASNNALNFNPCYEEHDRTLTASNDFHAFGLGRGARLDLSVVEHFLRTNVVSRAAGETLSLVNGLT